MSVYLLVDSNNICVWLIAEVLRKIDILLCFSCVKETNLKIFSLSAILLSLLLANLSSVNGFGKLRIYFACELRICDTVL